ncbi:ParA family partition ATPase [Brasilonema sp. UFV-L1]|uniref:ParA family partition ATPase n=1 Tax=Brasilonema sp. UFV-L1 TaxID=2234130 RepID=UPI00145F77FC|nr:ParA family partition ATPase [Brasilonema sp. UFV-L1]NMG11355.1 ParA family protein [Brasilonema sp. UFV-L1]
MKTVAIISRKGGAGKTTLTVHLAVAACIDGKETAIIDLDPQASAAGWGDSRKQEIPAVVSAQAARLPKVLEAAVNNGADLAIIDTAPHSETAALAAIRAADLILIPCRPAILDLRAIGDTIDLVNLASKTAIVVLNAVPPRGSLADEAVEAIAPLGVSIAPIRIGQRAAFVHSLTAGQTAQEYEPEGKAAEEIQQVYKWMCKQLIM